MEKGPLNLLYNYSKKYLSLQQKFARFALTIGSGVLLAILIFFLIDLSNSYPDKVAFYIAVFLSILVSTVLSLIKEDREIKKLRAKQIAYARSFTLLHDKYTEALKDIKARDQFLSIISHEIKTPLAVMLLNLHSLSKSIQTRVSHLSNS